VQPLHVQSIISMRREESTVSVSEVSDEVYDEDERGSYEIGGEDEEDDESFEGENSNEDEDEEFDDEDEELEEGGWLEIGTIVSAHGIKGELKVLSSTDFPQERFLEGGTRYLWRHPKVEPSLEDDLEPVELKGRPGPGKDMFLITLEDVKDRTTAQSYRGYRLFVPADDLPEMEEGDFHVTDLLDLQVVLHNTDPPKVIGQVTDFIASGSSLGNDLLQIETLSGKSFLIPFVEELVPVVDLEKEIVEISPPEGLLPKEK